MSPSRSHTETLREFLTAKPTLVKPGVWAIAPTISRQDVADALNALLADLQRMEENEQQFFNAQNACEARVQRLEEALERITLIPFDPYRSQYAQAHDIAEAALRKENSV